MLGGASNSPHNQPGFGYGQSGFGYGRSQPGYERGFGPQSTGFGGQGYGAGAYGVPGQAYGGYGQSGYGPGDPGAGYGQGGYGGPFAPPPGPQSGWGYGSPAQSGAMRTGPGGGFGEFGVGRTISQPGPRRNRGPQGYRRSDDRIRDDIYDRLMDLDDVETVNVTVLVTDGEVTLEGDVDDRRSKYVIEDIADSVLGVQDVNNRLRVQREGWKDARSLPPQQPRGSSDNRSSAPGPQATARGTPAMGPGSRSSESGRSGP